MTSTAMSCTVATVQLQLEARLGGRRIGVSEARRQLPRLVREVANEGGRVDITLRGQAKVSLVRTAELELGVLSSQAGDARPPALAVELRVPPDRLVAVIHELRARTGMPRRERMDQKRVPGRR